MNEPYPVLAKHNQSGDKHVLADAISTNGAQWYEGSGPNTAAANAIMAARDTYDSLRSLRGEDFKTAGELMTSIVYRSDHMEALLVAAELDPTIQEQAATAEITAGMEASIDWCVGVVDAKLEQAAIWKYISPDKPDNSVKQTSQLAFPDALSGGLDSSALPFTQIERFHGSQKWEVAVIYPDAANRPSFDLACLDAGLRRIIMTYALKDLGPRLVIAAESVTLSSSVGDLPKKAARRVRVDFAGTPEEKAALAAQGLSPFTLDVPVRPKDVYYMASMVEIGRLVNCGQPIVV